MSIRAQNNKGFSLLEVLIAMALVMLVMSGIFSIANGALSLGSAMSAASLREMRIANFENQFRYFLANATTRTRLNGSSQDSVLVAENIGVPFTWALRSRLADSVRFILKTTKNGQSNVLIEHLKRDPSRPEKDPYELLGSVILLEGVRHWKWSFYDEKKEKWQDRWNAKDQAPLLVKLDFGLQSDARDFRYTFWVSKEGTSVVAKGIPQP